MALYARLGSCFLLIVFLYMLLIASSSSSYPERTINLLRNRRQICADGIYEHGGRNCCLCASGQRLKSHCTSTPDSGVCDPCDSGTYRSHPNYLESCEPCSSCDHPNTNLEVVEECTPHRDTKCRCKEGHYCDDGTESCSICQPCATCGEKEFCNTVCPKKRNNVFRIVVIIIPVLALVAVIGALVWKMRKGNPPPDSSNDVSEPFLVPDVDILPLLPDIAEKLGWADMKKIAKRSNMHIDIEHVELNNPQNSEERTEDLLRRWVELKGRTAATDLINILQIMHKNYKADQIMKILSNANNAV